MLLSKKKVCSVPPIERGTNYSQNLLGIAENIL